MSVLNLMLRPNLHNRTFDWIGDSYSPYIDEGRFLGRSLLGRSHKENQRLSTPGTARESIFEIAVPGFRKEDISISLAHDVLIVTGKCKNEFAEKHVYLKREFELRPFEFKYRLREPLDPENVRAECTNGMLRVYFKNDQKVEETQPRMIHIT